ncbi:Quercetin 2,3-dioxygenase [Stratiformator vulcanicus]|uniref:Quercetin 2,3-dioxygenase n=2 Tax=Stratiformator vulcanicus TaxID=2527980 RepID=A0A517R5N1_9PLAN|nr:Quercetin 2,3-dioxygenase [Stratiformator vulcanicus]
MVNNRRNFIRLTAAGLIHISARPFLAGADEPAESTLLLRQAGDRGHTDLGWLKSFHSFSFGKYYDQRHMGFRSLRVINDDRITPGRGFPTHPHRDMEILSYVMQGALQHRDSTGRGSVIRPGDVQLMTAGTGITHSEYNPSQSEANHFLQIWIQPGMKRVQPKYQQRRIEPAAMKARWATIAAPEQSSAFVTMNQDAHIRVASLANGDRLTHTVRRDRHAWLHVARGEINVNGTRLQTGDAIASSRPSEFNITGKKEAEILLFDLG